MEQTITINGKVEKVNIIKITPNGAIKIQDSHGVVYHMTNTLVNLFLNHHELKFSSFSRMMPSGQEINFLQ